MTQQRASSGISGLDDVLGGGGFPRNQMYLVEGDPGVDLAALGRVDQVWRDGEIVVDGGRLIDLEGARSA